MQIGKVLISALVFIFCIALFPILNRTTSSYTGDLKELVRAFPIVLIIIIATFLIIFLFKGDKN